MSVRAMDAWRTAPEKHVNRVRACFTDDSSERSGESGNWVAVRGDIESERDYVLMSDYEVVPSGAELGYGVFHIGFLRAKALRSKDRIAQDPVHAALSVLEKPEVSNWRMFLNQNIESGFESVAARMDAIIRDRVDAVISERDAARLRARGMVQDLLARLREKTTSGVELIPAEEAWKNVDFSVFHDEEE